MPGRVSDESSAEKASSRSGGSNVMKRPAGKGTKKPFKKPSKKHDDDYDDNEGPDDDHQPLPSQRDDEDDDDHGLDGLDELLDVGNLDDTTGGAAKRPASKSSGGTRKKPAGRKQAR